MLDQDMRTTTDMRVARNVYNAFDSMMNGGDQQVWSERYPTHWSIVARTQRLRMDMKKKAPEYPPKLVPIVKAIQELRAGQRHGNNS